MKLSTYKIRGNNDELIGVVENNSLINLNKFFGQISLLEMLKSDKIDWAQKQQIEETLSKIKKETEALKNIAESMDAINQAAEKHKLFPDDLMNKFSELRELINEILDPALMTDLDDI